MYLTCNDIELIAKGITDKYYKMHPNALRIDIELMIEEQYNIDAEFYTLSNDYSILGISTPYEMIIEVSDDGNPLLFMIDKNTILIEKALKDSKCFGRLQFTIAHEAAHQIINDFSSCGRKHVYYRNRNNKDWNEWQADTLASCLLLPKDKVFDMFTQMFPKGPILYYSPLNPKLYHPLQIMAFMFGVSMQALVIRLHRLGLIEKYSFDSTLDVYKEAI